MAERPCTHSPASSHPVTGRGGSASSTTAPLAAMLTRAVRHARPTVTTDTPSSAATHRAHDVALRERGATRRVQATMAATRACGGRPERGRSARPSRPPSAYRARQVITAGRETPSRRAISPLARPWPASRTIAARCARRPGAAAQPRRTGRSGPAMARGPRAGMGRSSGCTRARPAAVSPHRAGS